MDFNELRKIVDGVAHATYQFRVKDTNIEVDAHVKAYRRFKLKPKHKREETLEVERLRQLLYPSRDSTSS